MSDITYCISAAQFGYKNGYASHTALSAIKYVVHVVFVCFYIFCGIDVFFMLPSEKTANNIRRYLFAAACM